MIYHQTMTPSWLEAHASYIDSSHITTADQLTFNANSADYAALLKVPLIPAGVLQCFAPLTVKIVVFHDVSIGTKEDSDISYGLSDGISFVGFAAVDKNNFVIHHPCNELEGSSGARLASIRYTNFAGKTSDSHYPGHFLLTLKLDERWGSCYTAHDGGFLRTAGYNNRLMVNKGLNLEVYKEDKGERVGIKFIDVTVMQDA